MPVDSPSEPAPGATQAAAAALVTPPAEHSLYLWLLALVGVIGVALLALKTLVWKESEPVAQVITGDDIKILN